MRHLVITAPDQLRCRLKGMTVAALTAEAARLRPSRSGDLVMAAHKASLCSLAHRIQGLEDEVAELDERIEKLVEAVAPELLARFGVGPDTAGALLISAGDNPERLYSEARWEWVRYQLTRACRPLTDTESSGTPTTGAQSIPRSSAYVASASPSC